jgi:uncharacterized RDD family membrane protein YckC
MAASATPAVLDDLIAGDTKRVRKLVTPEGAYLTLRLASPADRLGAALIDFAVVTLAVIALVIGLVLAVGASQLSAYTAAIVTLSSFLFRIFYFPFCEFTLNGQTVGKRVLGIRAIDRRGGPLSAQSIIARNFLREIELWLPLTSVLTLSNAGLQDLLTIGWLLILSAFPLFTKDVTRLGDLAAGTWVIQSPKAVLLPDLTQAAARTGAFSFTREQLDAYGEYELEVLAKVLRENTPATAATIPEVAARIRAKIGWVAAPNEDPRAFLLAYYRALRRHLETGLLFGKRKARKATSA